MLSFVQRTLMLAGLVLVCSAAVNLGSFHAFQLKASQLTAPQGQVLGRLEIPRLQLSVTLLDSDDERSLALSAGHIPGTSPIGSLGNAGFAGHRDTTFRALRFIRIGDRIETQTNHHASYIVDSLHIVDPSDTSLLALNATPTLTLVTCYPFDYVGSAPKRFVVQARLVL